jgi:ribonuclease HII
MRNYLKLESPTDLKIEDFVESKFPAKFFYKTISPVLTQVDFDQSHDEKYWIVGIDEAGRGPVAGPVTAGACMLSSSVLCEPQFSLLNDSKKLNEKRRQELYPRVKNSALAWGTATCSPQEIDEHNILGATFIAMKRALKVCLDSMLAQANVQSNNCEAQIKPVLLLVDGNQFIRGLETEFNEIYPTLKIYQCPVIQGDGHFALISAASILAKVERDHDMYALAKQYPEYDLEANKGYPSPKHIEAIKVHGRSSIHRQTFHMKALDEPDLFNG